MSAQSRCLHWLVVLTFARRLTGVNQKATKLFTERSTDEASTCLLGRGIGCSSATSQRKKSFLSFVQNNVTWTRLQGRINKQTNQLGSVTSRQTEAAEVEKPTSLKTWCSGNVEMQTCSDGIEKSTQKSNDSGTKKQQRWHTGATMAQRTGEHWSANSHWNATLTFKQTIHREKQSTARWWRADRTEAGWRPGKRATAQRWRADRAEADRAEAGWRPGKRATAQRWRAEREKARRRAGNTTMSTWNRKEKWQNDNVPTEATEMKRNCGLVMAQKQCKRRMTA